MDDRTIPLEERLAHLERALDDLSGVVARQDRVIDALTRHVRTLLDREADREAAAAREAPIDRPPHW